MWKPLLYITTALLLLSATSVHAEKLRIVTLYSPPLAYEEGGEVKGFAVDLVMEGLRRIGREADITIMPWKRAVFMTRFGEADAIFYAVKNAEREEWFFYPKESLVVEATVALRRVDTDIVLRPGKTAYDDYRLGIGRGYYYGPKLKQFLASSSFAKVEEATSFELNFSKLIEKRIDVFLADYNLARYFIGKKAAKNLVEVVTDEDGKPIFLDSVDSYLAFSRETMTQETAQRFSQALHEMKIDGTYDHIIRQYQ